MTELEMTEVELNNYLSKFHRIDPDKSNYITFKQYCKLGDVVADLAAQALLENDDDIRNNHSLSTIILQGPEYDYSSDTLFVRLYKKYILHTPRPERLRIVLDDKYCTDVDMTAVSTLQSIEDVVDLLKPRVFSLIKKSK